MDILFKGGHLQSSELKNRTEVNVNLILCPLKYEHWFTYNLYRGVSSDSPELEIWLQSTEVHTYKVYKLTIN